MADNRAILRATQLYYGDRWIFLKSNLKGVTSQSVLRSDDSDFPVERVEKWLTDDKRIINVSYGVEDKCWVILCHRYDFDVPRVGKQRLFITPDLPEQQIRNAWRDNAKVIVLNYCRDVWVMVTEENSSDVIGQALSTWGDIEDVKGEVGKIWKNNKAVQTLVHGKVDGSWKWVLLAAPADNAGGQTFYVNSDWPMDKIGDYYKNKKYISTLAWNQPEEYWVIICGPHPGGQSLATGGDFPLEKVQAIENLYFYVKSPSPASKKSFAGPPGCSVSSHPASSSSPSMCWPQCGVIQAILQVSEVIPTCVHKLPGISAHSLDRRNRMALKLKDSNADIVFLQEVQLDEHQEFSSVLAPNYDNFGLCKNQPHTWAEWLKGFEYQENGVLVLLRRGLFKNVNIQNHQMSVDGNTCCVVTCQYNSSPLVLINSHLETLQADQREIQSKFIQNLVSRLLHENRAQKVFWAGDFNEEREGPNIVRLLQQQLPPASPSDASQAQFVDLLGGSTQPTCHTVRWSGRIDYILAHGITQIVECSVPHTPKHENPRHCTEWGLSTFGSDHLPISATVLLE